MTFLYALVYFLLILKLLAGIVALSKNFERHRLERYFLVSFVYYAYAVVEGAIRVIANFNAAGLVLGLFGLFFCVHFTFVIFALLKQREEEFRTRVPTHKALSSET